MTSTRINIYIVLLLFIFFKKSETVLRRDYFYKLYSYSTVVAKKKKKKKSQTNTLMEWQELENCYQYKLTKLHCLSLNQQLLIAAFDLLQDMLLKRAADIAEALYSVPRPHSQLQALPSSPAHGSVMGLGSYPSQLGVSIGEPGQSSQGE